MSRISRLTEERGAVLHWRCWLGWVYCILLTLYLHAIYHQPISQSINQL